MFENHYNTETNTNESEYVPAPPEKKKKKSKAAKCAAVILCLALVGGGSVAGYRYFSNDKVKDNDRSVNEKIDDEDITEVQTSDIDINETEEDYRASNLSYLSKGNDSLTTQEIYKKCLPSSVGITSTFEVQVPYGNRGGTTTKEGIGTGTGIIMSDDGYIITNAHVIYNSDYKSKAKKVGILLSDQSELEAEIVGYDVQADVALLKAETNGRVLTAAEFGNSDETVVGDFAVAIGNPLGFDLFGTLTVGYISGLKREISVDTDTIPLIQTDAAINNGNSGGPLINDRGQVIGINSSKLSSNYSSGQASIEGLGFAIPINEALEIVEYLKSGEEGQQTVKKIQLGITCREVSAASDVNADVYGLLVTDIISDGPADRAGVKVNDVIVGADGEAVQTFNEFNSVKNKKKAGDSIKLTIIRDRQYYTIDVVLEEMEVSEEPEEVQEELPEGSQIPDEIPEEQEIPQIPDNGQGGNGGYNYNPFEGFDPFGFDPFEDFFGDIFR